MATVNHFTTVEKFEDKIKKLGADHHLDLHQNEFQRITISGTPTGGTFDLTYDGETASGIVYNATAAAIQSALEALANLSVGDVICTGGALPDNFVEIEFAGNLADTDTPLMTADNSLTGGTTPTIEITEEVRGITDAARALQRLNEAYNAIEGALIPRGLSVVQISTWARGEEFQLDIATYWYAKDSGWGGKLVDEVDWTKVFDRTKKLSTVAIINNDGVLLSAGHGVAVGMDLMDINENLGYLP